MGREVTAFDVTMMMREGGNVERCHGFLTHRNQTNGHHSYNAVNIYLQYHPSPRIETIKAILRHDVAERGVGDTPHPAKAASLALKVAYETLEVHVLARFGLEYDLPSTEQEWLNACDLIEFLMFAQEERNMGNRYVKNKISKVQTILHKMIDEEVIPVELLSLVRSLTCIGVQPLTDEFVLGEKDVGE